MRTGNARTGLSAKLACQKRWNACGKQLPFGPEVGAVCGKAARTDLGGGRSCNERPYRYGVGPFEAPLIDSPGDVRIGSMH